MALNNRQRAFVTEYLVDYNGTRAAIRAGYAEVSAHDQAYNLLSNSEVTAAIQEKIDERAVMADLSAVWVLRQWKQIAEADPNEIIWNENECCRYCHSVEHRYQWTRFEYAHAVEAAAAHRCNQKCGAPCDKAMPPDGSGGFDYTPHKAPVIDCPVCHGRGLQRVLVADTRRLKGSARRLYAGIKTTQHGVEIKFRDQDAALKNIAQYLGMLIEKKELAGKDGGPITVATRIRAEDLTDDQLAQILLEEESAAGEDVVK